MRRFPVKSWRSSGGAWILLVRRRAGRERMFKSARWRGDKNKVKAVFKLQFHATQVSLLHSVFFKIIYVLGFQY